MSRYMKCARCHKWKEFYARRMCRSCYNYMHRLGSLDTYPRMLFPRNDIKNMAEHAPRRFEIITMLANGWTTPEIAEELNISASSIKRNIANGFSRYAIRTRYELVAKAVRAGIVEFEDAKTPR